MAAFSYGQDRLVGSVVSEADGESLPGAVVRLIAQDGSDHQSVLVATEGTYQIQDIPAGTYDLEITYFGHAPYQQGGLSFTGAGTVQKMDISLEPTSAWLEEVEVSGRRAAIRTENGVQVYDISAMPSLQSTSLSEALGAIPSISVNDQDGRLEMRGGKAVLLINGKPVNRNPAAVLRQLNTSQIQEIQVNSSPGAQYTAEGGGGVVNVILKKNTQRGFNTDIDVSTGNVTQNIYVGVNYNNSKINVSLEPTLASIDAPISRKRTSIFPSGLEQENTFDGNYVYKYLGVTAGLDVYLDSTSTIFFSADFYGEGNDDDISGVFKNTNGGITSDTAFDTELDYEVPGYILDLGYQKKFPKAGGELLIGLLYEYYEDQENYDYRYFRPGTAVPEHRLIRNGGEDFLYQGNIDFTQPLSQNTNLDMGGQFFLNTGDDFSRFFSQTAIDSAPVELTNLFNNYDEHNQVSSGYVSLNKDWEKLSATAGLRAEHTLLQLDLTARSAESEVEQDYNSLFPSLALSYSIDDNQALNLSYGRRIRRPSGYDLNPFVNELDTSRLWAGNPNLQPEFINAFEFSYRSNMNENVTFSINPYYRIVDDLIRMSTQLNSENVTLFMPENFGSAQTLGTDLNLSISPANWLDLRLAGNYNHINFDDDLPFLVNSSIDQLTGTYSADFYFPGDLTFTASGRVKSEQDTYQGNVDGSSAIHFSLDKTLFDGDGGLALITRNVFNSDDTEVNLLTADGVRMQDFFADRDRLINLNFYYSFGSAQKRSRRQRAQEEDRGNGEDIIEN